MFGQDAGEPEPAGEPQAPADSMETADEGSPDLADVEDEGPAEATEPEEELPAEPPRAGYLVFPDNTEQPIPPSQWLIGRTDLAKFLHDPKKANEISRVNLTVLHVGDRFFVDDVTTMVQANAST